MMKNYLFNKKFTFTFVFLFLSILFFSNHSFAKEAPSSFANLAEKLMPSVVNISATSVVETRPKPQQPFPFQFPPGSPFEDFFKEYNQQQKHHKKENQQRLDLDL